MVLRVEGIFHILKWIIRSEVPNVGDAVMVLEFLQDASGELPRNPGPTTERGLSATERRKITVEEQLHWPTQSEHHLVVLN